MNKLNYYDILQISNNATGDEIKIAYRKLVKQFHPDIYKAENANEIISKINEAYNSLSNSKLRAEYDARNFSSFGFNKNLEDLFNDEFDDFYYGNESSSFKNKNKNYEKSQATTQFSNDNYGVKTENFGASNLKNGTYEFKNEKINRYYDNAFELHANKTLIQHFAKAFEISWDQVLATLNESPLNKKQIYLRCYHNLHYFDTDKLSAKQLLAENFHKSILVLTKEYQAFVKNYENEKNRLDLEAIFYFDEELLKTDFKKIIRYYRLYECDFCKNNGEKLQFLYCNFCLNNHFLKERMAIQITWKANSNLSKIAIYPNYGNRNDEFIGNLKLTLAPISAELVGVRKSHLVIDYKKPKFNIDEIQENKVL